MPESSLSTWQRLYSSSRKGSNDDEKRISNNPGNLLCHQYHDRLTAQLEAHPKINISDDNQIDDFKIREWVETIQAKVDAKATNVNNTNQPRLNFRDKTDYIDHDFHLTQTDTVFASITKSGEQGSRNQDNYIKDEKENTSNYSIRSDHETCFHDVNNILQQFSKKLRICPINQIHNEQSQNENEKRNEMKTKHKLKKRLQKSQASFSSNQIAYGEKKIKNRNIDNNVPRRSSYTIPHSKTCLKYNRRFDNSKYNINILNFFNIREKFIIPLNFNYL